MSVEVGLVPFKTARCLRDQAHKALEEASELCEAAKRYEKVPHDAGRLCVLDELADAAQALVNLAACVGVTAAEWDSAQQRCTARNRARGRL